MLKLSICFLIAALSSLAFPEEVNLARTAKATASESYGDMTPEKGIDGTDRTRWSGIPGHNTGVWYELSWTQPHTVGEVVVRQYDRFTFTWDLQIWQSGAWKTVGHYGQMGTKLPKIVLMRIQPAVETTKIRIANITNGPSFTEVEVYANPDQHPRTLAAASDLRGNFVGILTDSLGAEPVANATVTISGKSPVGAWSQKALTDAHGMFFAPMPPGMSGAVDMSGGGAKLHESAANFQYGLTPLDMAAPRAVLEGGWRFAVDPPSDFWKPDFDDRKWATIKVPAHWEMEGFRSPDGVGGYRKTFELPAGQGRTKIRFDGVYSGAEVWVNGQRVAYHEGGFTPFEADITDVAKQGTNVLALRVTEHTTVSDDLDKMSLYADFPLSGIIRKVTVYSVPAPHVAGYDAATKFQGSSLATVTGSVRIVNESDAAIKDGGGMLTLLDADGKAVSSVDLKLGGPLGPWSQTEVPFSFGVADAKGWSAERPYLYTLAIDLRNGRQRLQHLTQRFGLRETTVQGTQILINGSPVKFRGTCHHDSHPTMGRAVTPELTRQDLSMMKEANLNSVRTSHYPPIPELVEYADEMGLYVEDEASFCWVGASSDLRNTPRIIQLTAELLARDRNHPSVFMWSLCNESEFGYGFERSHEWVRNVDPSRPTSAATSAWLEIATLHNPIAISRIHENEHIDKPLLFDESLCIFQGIFNDVAEMWVDPGIRDYYTQPLPGIYREFMDSKTTQGSQIWCWADDLFAVPGRGLEYGRGTTQSHFADDQYKFPGRGIVGDAPWGVVDGWRRKKPEFWTTKKLHSPVKLPEKPIAAYKPGDTIRIPVENQYDFLNLSEIRATYQIGGETGPVPLDVAPRSKGELVVRPRSVGPADAPLILRFDTADGKLIDEYQLPILTAPKPKTVSVNVRFPLDVREESTLSGNSVHIVGPWFEVAFDRDGGYMKRCVAGSQPLLLEFPALHVMPTNAPTAPLPVRTGWDLKKMSVTKDGANVRVHLEGTYPLFEGSYDFLIQASGEIEERSHFTYLGEDMLAREIGLRFSVPRDCDQLSWRRNGDWSAYPDGHIGRNVGTARAFADHLTTVPPVWDWSQDNSPMGSNDFRSTKRSITFGSIGYESGAQVEVDSDGSQSLRAMVETDRISIHVNDWYGGTNVGWGEWITNYGRGKAVKKGDVLESHLRLRLLVRER